MNLVRKIKNKIGYFIFMLGSSGKEKFECPICNYSGPFMDLNASTGLRRHAKCPKCNALERHRFQYLVMKQVLDDINASELKMLHFAPEPFFRNFFSERFGRYETADLNMQGVDYIVDLEELPFDDGAYDFVFASHVLEHIPNDEKAISEIRRILSPKGIAVLPVPIVADKTIEYPEPNPHETCHVRAPGFDYYDRYDRYFPKIDKIFSDSMPSKYQVFIYEDRTHLPTKKSPLRPAMQGEKHVDIIPVCYV